MYKSSDGGTSWSQKNSGLPANPNVSQNGLLLDSASGDLFLPLATDKVYRSSDGGESWTPADPDIGCSSSALTMNSSKTLFGVFCHGAVYKSSDKGESWANMSDGLGNMDNVEGINILGLFANQRDLLFLSSPSDGIYTFSQTPFSWNLYLPAIMGSQQ